MPEKIVRMADKNRLVIPKQAFDALELKQGGYVLVKWDPDIKKIEIIPCVIKPAVPA